MTQTFCLFFVLIVIDNTLGATIINSFINEDNRIDNDCGLTLTPELIAEIENYQPIVNKIVATAVNGPFSGSTWKRYCGRGAKKKSASV